MSIYEQGKIFYVNLHYRDKKTKKIITKARPALIISNNNYNLQHNSLLVCSITKIIRNWKYSIYLDRDSFSNGSLPLDSELRVDLIHNINKEEVSKYFGLVNSKILMKTISNLNQLVKD